MKKNSIISKVVIGALALSLVLGVVCNGVVSSKASSTSEVVCTETFAENSDRIVDMTEEEFNEVFDNDQYATEFSRTYNSRVTRGEANSDLAVQLLVNLTSEQINELIDGIYNKLPSFVQKLVSREKINDLIVEFIQYLKTNEDVQNKVEEFVEYVSEKTHISKSVVKVVVEFALQYVQEVFADDVNPTTDPTVEPTVLPTVAPTMEPTVAPTSEPTVEPTLEVVVSE